MTVAVAQARPQRADRLALLAIALGCLALVTRPVSYASTIATMLVGLTGLAAFRSRTRERTSTLAWLLVVATGAGAFGLARVLGPGLGVRLTHAGIAATVVAGVAEEAFFRRFVYGWIERRAGVVTAIGVSAALFALVHIPTYGVGVLPVDLTAGVLLGWQRWATGGWTAPALTHTLANLLMLA